MKRNITFLLLGLLVCNGGMRATGQSVQEQEARETAARFLGAQTGLPMQKSALNCAYTEQDADAPLFYVFNGENAFVVVSAEKRTKSVLAYSTSQNFDPENIIPPVRMWLDSYRRQIQAAKGSSPLPSKIRQYATDDSIIRRVEPLLRSQWGQGYQYNLLCPKDDKNSSGHCVTGCVATALAQLAYYFRWPDNGVGSYSYTHSKYGTIAADFSKGYYNYNNMCDAPSQINRSISSLIAHLGASVDMDYGPSGSGMYNHKAAYVLRTYFKFNPETQYIFRDSTNHIHDSLQPAPRHQNWDSTIIAHLDKNIPLYYAGWSKPWTDGHAFVCDGYQLYASGDCYFHFNFGWEGKSDGYFYTSNLFPGSYNFNLAQELVVNAWPDTIRHPHRPIPDTTEGSRELYHTGSFEDGSGPFANCRCGMDYTWRLRRIKSDSVISMNVRIVCQLGTGDTLFVTSPDKKFASQAYTEIDSLITWENNVFDYDFRLVTGNRGESKGIHVSYETVHPVFCLRLMPYNKMSGTISDGSGPYNYGYNSCCEAVINVKNAAGIRIHFTKFQTFYTDFLQFYDMNDSNRLLQRFSGELKGDSDFYFPTNFIYVLFESSEAFPLDGWSFDYTASKAGLAETGKEQLRIWPNPAQTELHIENISGAPIGEIRLTDLTGRLLQRRTAENGQLTLHVSELPKGLYLLHLHGNHGTQVYKFVKD